MGQHLAGLLYLSALSACSLYYNPSDLPDKGKEVDAAITDANPALLHVDEVKSPVLLEGTGQDGSPPAVLVVYGGHITKGATVTIAPRTPDPNIAITYGTPAIASDGNSLAVTVTAGYLDTLDQTGANASPDIPLVISVMQEGAPAPVTIEDWSLRPLDELTTTGTQQPPAAGTTFSRVMVDGAMDFPPGGQRVVIRAVGMIDIKGVVRANASGVVGGAGGCNGGGVGTRGECYGGGGAGAGATNGGGGGGFAERGSGTTGGQMSGDPLLASYSTNGPEMSRGGGGGGGQPTLVTLLGGGPGGGGGGAIDITGGGNVAVQGVEANGAAGGGGTVGGGGGGGAGGAVVVRSSAKLTFPTVSVAPGTGGGGVGTGGAGSVGRWRYDANATDGTMPTTPGPGRGPMFNLPANPIFDVKNPSLTVVGDPGVVTLAVTSSEGVTSLRSVPITSGSAIVEPPNLSVGFNRVCVVIAGADPTKDEGRNCLDVAFVP